MAGLDLGKQVGPLPLGGWIVVVAGGLGIGYLMNRNMSKAPEEPSVAQLTESGVGTGGAQFIYDAPGTGSNQNTTPETNASWGVKVLNWLIAQNHNPSVADATVRKYLTGLPLNAAEQALINLALIQFQAPPEPLPVVDQPPPATDTRVAPAAVVSPHVNRFTKRNVVAWTHDGKNVTRFVINARVRESGNTTTAIVPAVWRVNKYSWDHFAAPNTAKAYTIDYEIVPFNEEKRGPARFVSAKFIL